MTEDIETKEKAKHISYKGMEQLDFQIMLTDNYCVNPNSIHLCFPMKIKKSRNEASNTDTNLITVNNMFSHQIKEISATRFGHDKQLISTFSPYGIYQYSKAMLKHLPKDSLKKTEKAVLYSKQPICINKTIIDRRINYGSGSGTSGTGAPIAARKANDAKDLDIEERIEKFQNQLKSEYIYRVTLRYSKLSPEN